MEPDGRSWLFSMSRSWLLSLGSKDPSHGTNSITTRYVRGWILAVGHIWVSKLFSSLYLLNRFADSWLSNSGSMALCSVN